MALFELSSAAKQVYELYGFIEDMLTDKMSQIIENIGRKELYSAMKTLSDSRKSNNKEREIASTVTQLRLALEKTEDELVKAKISSLIAFCYSVLNDLLLARSYELESIKYFNSFIDGKMTVIQTSSDMADIYRFAFVLPWLSVRNSSIGTLIMGYNGLLRIAGDLGLYIDEKEIGSFSNVLSFYFSCDTEIIRKKAINIAQKLKQKYASSLNNALPIK